MIVAGGQMLRRTVVRVGTLGWGRVAGLGARGGVLGTAGAGWYAARGMCGKGTDEQTLASATGEAATPTERIFDRVWDEPNLDVIYENNRAWVRRMLDEDPEFFEKLKHGQTPQYLFIGCSDSRVPAQDILGLKAGELFVHRNVANLALKADNNLSAVLAYAVGVLEVQDIIVCGHYGCGGIKAASQIEDFGELNNWLCHIKDVMRLHWDELQAIDDEEERHRRLVELNVEEQCLNVFGHPAVQRQHAKTGRPRIHGFVYDIGNGLLQKLNINFKDLVAKYHDVYAVLNFREGKSGSEPSAPTPTDPASK